MKFFDDFLSEFYLYHITSVNVHCLYYISDKVVELTLAFNRIYTRILIIIND
jgi:hypothetical protein